MASAGRPFTAELVLRLAVRGVAVTPVVLHAGVSSPELHEPPLPERFAVPAATAALVEATRAAGGRVVAVGTTVTRALESAAPDGTVRAARGWTDLVLGPHRPARVAGVARHVDDGVPGLVGDLGKGVVAVAVGLDEGGAGRRVGRAACDAGEVVAPAQALLRHGPAQPCGPTEHEHPHRPSQP